MYRIRILVSSKIPLSGILPDNTSVFENGETGAVAKLSIAIGHAMQIYNCLGQLRQL